MSSVITRSASLHLKEAGTESARISHMRDMGGSLQDRVTTFFWKISTWVEGRETWILVLRERQTKLVTLRSQHTHTGWPTTLCPCLQRCFQRQTS